MIELKTESELAVLREAGRVVATVLQALRRSAAVGTSLLELDAQAAALLSEAGAKSSFLHYHPRFAPSPYPAVLCTSVNDAVVHGIPTDYRLRDGDLLSVDFGASVDGWHGDAAISFVVGTADPADEALIQTTERGLAAGIAQAKPGNRLGDVSHAVGVIGRRAGYGLLPTTVGTASAGRCTRSRMCPTKALPAKESACGPAWSSRSSRCSWRVAATSTATARTAGRCSPWTAAAPRMSSTPWPSPRTARES